jgi:hypothetical protein
MLVAVMGLLLSAGMPSAYGSTVIAFDAAASNSCTSCLVTLTWPHTIGGGTNGILIVGVSEFGNDPAPPPLPPVVSIMYGSSSLTFIAAQNDLTNVVVRAEAWYLLNPPTGTASITVTFSSIPVVGGSVVGGSVSYFNVAGLGTSNSATSLSTTSGNPASVTVNANAGDLVTDVLAMNAESIIPATPGVGQTPRWNVAPPTSSLVGAGSDKPASSPVTMTWTGVNVPIWALIGIDLQPAPTTFPAVHQTPVGGIMLPSIGLTVLLPWAVVLSLLGVLSVEAFRVKRRAKRR